MHLTDEYPIKYEGDRLPPPVVADLNGDGKKEVLVATHDAKIQVIWSTLPCSFWFMQSRVFSYGIFGSIILACCDV